MPWQPRSPPPPEPPASASLAGDPAGSISPSCQLLRRAAVPPDSPSYAAVLGHTGLCVPCRAGPDGTGAAWAGSEAPETITSAPCSFQLPPSSGAGRRAGAKGSFCSTWAGTSTFRHIEAASIRFTAPKREAAFLCPLFVHAGRALFSLLAPVNSDGFRLPAARRQARARQAGRAAAPTPHSPQ